MSVVELPVISPLLSPGLGLVPLFPLFGAFLAYVIGRRAKGMAGWIASGASLCSFGLVLLLVSWLKDEPGKIEFVLLPWFTLKDLSVDFLLRFDELSAVMSLVVTGVGSLIHIYSIAYMAEDEGRHRFFCYLNLFMFSMLLLVLGGNLLVLFVGWEGVGLCSYLLIGFWFKNAAYAAAGRKAFVVNRIGDAGFLLGIFLLFERFGSLDFAVLYNAVQALPAADELVAFFTLVTLCFFVGATGKSAQWPLFVWLPDAMAGPTPVSALIHAATMVTAGVYMTARLHFLFSLAPFTLFIICLIAVLTAFMAATIALTQFDIKKVLAYSTVSQLGFMFIGAAAGAYWVAIFHLVTHAFFKACLFLGAGSVIHGCHHEQDMRHLGGLRKVMPWTFGTYLISTLAISGIFPFAGYQSKHAILAALEGSHNAYFHLSLEILTGVAAFTAFLTAFYMTRSLVLTFFGEYRGHGHAHESPLLMILPLVILAALATVAGVWLEGSLPHYLSHVLPVEHGSHHESIVDGIKHSWVGLLGMALAFLLYTSLREVPGKVFKAILPLGKLSQGKWYWDEIYAACLVRPLEGLSLGLWKVVDQGVIDGAVNGTGAFVDVNGEVVRGVQTGQVQHYALFMFLGGVLIAAVYLMP